MITLPGRKCTHTVVLFIAFYFAAAIERESGGVSRVYKKCPDPVSETHPFYHIPDTAFAPVVDTGTFTALHFSKILKDYAIDMASTGKRSDPVCKFSCIIGFYRV